MGSYIIGFIVFAAFARAAREYKKSALAWGAIGLAAFFVPQFLIALIGLLLLRWADAFRGSIFVSVADLVISAVVAAWVYNKLMDGAIQEMASRDAEASRVATPPPLIRG